MLSFKGFFHLFLCNIFLLFLFSWNIIARFGYQSYSGLINELQNVFCITFGRVYKICIISFLYIRKNFLEKMSLPDEFFPSSLAILLTDLIYSIMNSIYNVSLFMGAITPQIPLDLKLKFASLSLIFLCISLSLFVFWLILFFLLCIASFLQMLGHAAWLSNDLLLRN